MSNLDTLNFLENPITEQQENDIIEQFIEKIILTDEFDLKIHLLKLNKIDLSDELVQEYIKKIKDK